GPAFDQGKLVKEEVPHSNPAGMQGIVYNLRNPLFQNVALREAMTYALDFEWSNANLFYGQYNRTRSYFQNSDMAATGLPTEAELELLEPLRDDIPERVFTESYEPPKSDGSGRPRANLARAQTLLKKAGYQIREGQLHSPDGTPVSFQIMLHQPAFERILLPFARNLKALGIDAQVVKVDTSQYVERIRNFNFDMVVSSFAQSSSPGNEQLEYWGSDAAEDPSSRNIIGIQNPAVDTLVDAIVTATTRDQLITACRALDRVLQWNFYVIPNWYAAHHRLSCRSRLKHPSLPEYVGIDGAIDTWWDSNAQ
ncbi:MAG TPA: ABC transporter substrate-binding protein, partial [Alcanivorax sp.]|nr:ABC transporter substrate-binding protein [Alcanivorax sp.]